MFRYNDKTKMVLSKKIKTMMHIFCLFWSQLLILFYHCYLESIYEKKIDPNYDYPLEKLNVIKKLGEGNFACVYKAEADSIISDGVTSAVAVKYLKGMCV